MEKTTMSVQELSAQLGIARSHATCIKGHYHHRIIL